MRADDARAQSRHGVASSRRSVAQVLDRTPWDLPAMDEPVSPLMPAGRYFRNFPWDGLGPSPDDAAATDESGEDGG